MPGVVPPVSGAERDLEARQLAGQLPLDPATANLQGRMPGDVRGTVSRLGLRVPNGTRTDLRNQPATREDVINAFRRVLLAGAGLLTLEMAACAPTPPPPMAADPGPVAATTPDRTMIISVNFDFDSHRIRPEYFHDLDAVADGMASPQLGGYSFDVSGHTDRAGRFAYNVALSLLRARAVVNYLALRGVARERMRAQGFGYLAPLDPSNPYGAVNRRVEVTSIR